MMFSWLCALFWMLAMSAAAPIEKIMVDMTYVYDEHVQNFPMWKNLEMTVVMNGTLGDSGAWVLGEEITTATHMGTHMDAPSHFAPGGLNIDQIPISHLIAPAAVINIKAKAQEDPDAEVTVEDLENWERVTGHSLDGTIVLVNSGWSKFWYNRTAFIGTSEEDVSKMHFPGIGPEAAQWLVDNRNIYGVGSDTLSFDKEAVSYSVLHSLAQDFNRLLTTEASSDVDVFVGSVRIPAHSLILSARSPVFAAMFRHDMQERSEGVIHIKDFAVSTIRYLLRFIYTSEVPDIERLSSESLVELYTAADKYEVTELADICLQAVEVNFSEENLKYYATLAVKHDKQKMLDAVVSFVADNPHIIHRDVWEELSKMIPTLAQQVLLKLAKNIT